MKRLIWMLSLTFALLGGSPSAIAGETLPTEAMLRLEERLREQREDGLLPVHRMQTLVIASVVSDKNNTQVLTNALAQTLGRALAIKVMICDSCAAGLIQSGERTIYESGFVDLDRVRAAYDTWPEAALWAEASGPLLSIRIVSVRDGEVLFADTIDPRVDWSARSVRSFSLSRLNERKARGEVILHTQYDIGLLPLAGSPHIGWSLMQQWGSSNQYLSGFSLNLSDPILGIGVNWFRVMPGLSNSLLGFKLMASLPRLMTEALSRGSKNNSPIEDKPVSLIGMIKFPMFGPPEKFYFNAYVSTNGSIGLGLSF